MGQCRFNVRRSLSKRPRQVTLPAFRRSLGVVKQAPPAAVTIIVFLPIPVRPQSFVSIGAAIAGNPGSAAAFERQRLHDLGAIAATETERARIGGSTFRIAPEQQALTAGPDAMNHTPLAILAQQIAIAIAQKITGALTDLQQTIKLLARWCFYRTDISLVIRQPQMFGPKLGREANRLAGAEGLVEHRLVQTFGVQIDFDFPAASSHAVKDRLPEIVTAFCDSAFAMSANSYAADCRTSL